MKDGNIEFTNCNIDSNNCYARAVGSGTQHAYAYGAGIYVNTGILLLTNCIVSNNSQTASAEGIHEYGGGIFSASGTVILENSTIAYNTKEGIYNGDGIIQVVNSIIYANSGTSISGNALVTYSNIQGEYAGEGNIDADPLFESLFSLKIRCDYSSCVDTGSPQPWYNEVCFLPPSCGTERNDMGAHGGPGACGWCAYGQCTPHTPVIGDLDGDGDVDASDLVIFSVNYGIDTIF